MRVALGNGLGLVSSARAHCVVVRFTSRGDAAARGVQQEDAVGAAAPRCRGAEGRLHPRASLTRANAKKA